MLRGSPAAPDHAQNSLAAAGRSPAARAPAGSLQREGGSAEWQISLRWEDRLRLTQSSLASQEPILALRRQLAALSGAQ